MLGSHGMQILRALAIILLALSAAFAADAQTPPDNFRLPPLTHVQNNSGPPYTYIVRTVNPVRRSGDVVVLGVHWSCRESACTASGPWPRPLVPACIALAREIGPVAAVGRPGAVLTLAQIATCNAGLAAPTPTPAPRDPGIALRTAELSAVGGADVPVSAPVIPLPLSLTTPELSVVGGAATSATPPPIPPPMSITTPELSAVGN